MGLSGTRGLVRISKVPGCDLQAAMVAEQVDERDFYQSVTGSAFEGEFGERTSARRRGNKFESNLHMNNAAGLRRALGPLVGADPEEMTVRDFGEEVPGPPGVLHAIRLKRMREILDDLAAGRVVPDLVIQAQLQLWVGPGTSVRDHEYVTPDFLVLDRALGMYLPGEEKSFIVRDGVADGADLFLTRRQAGAQILALRSEAARVGLADRVANEARFIFATPFGLSAAAPVIERLHGEVHEIERAIVVLSRVRGELVDLRAGSGVPLPLLVDEFETDYGEPCVGTCILAPVCAARHRATTRSLGAAAVDALGETQLDILYRLLDGAEPRDDFETVLAAKIRDALSALGIDGRGVA